MRPGLPWDEPCMGRAEPQSPLSTHVSAMVAKPDAVLHRVLHDWWLSAAPRPPYWAAWVALAYASACLLGSALHFPGTPLSALWAPNAVVLAALVLAPYRHWPIYLLTVLAAHLLVQLSAFVTPIQVLIQYVANVGLALIGAIALRVLVPGVTRIDRLSTAAAFIFLCGALAPLISSAFMAAAFGVFGLSAAFWATMVGRTLTNAFAIVTLVPLILNGAAAVRRKDHRVSRGRAAEAFLLTCIFAALAIGVHAEPDLLTDRPWSLMYALCAALLWAAVRFGVAGACSSVLVVGVLAIFGRIGQSGAVSISVAAERMVDLQLALVLLAAILLVVATAVEERKWMKQVAAEGEAELRTMFTQNLVPTVLWHADGRILDANESFLLLTGYDRSDIEANRIDTQSLIGTTLDEPQVQWPDSDAVGNIKGRTVERLMLLRDGRRLPVLVGGGRFRGSPERGVAYLIDLSALRQVEAQRRDEEALHSAVLASIHEQIVVLDRTGVVLETNQLSRHRLEHAMGLPFGRAYVGDDYLEDCVKAAKAGDPIAQELHDCVREVLARISVRRRLEFSRRDLEELRWYEMSVEPLRRLDGGVVVTLTDITASKLAIHEAQEQRLQLAHLGRVAVLGELSGAFAHELAQPLTSILGNAEAALQIVRSETGRAPDVEDILMDIIKDDVRAAEVIQRLRAMLARGEIQRQPTDLNQVVRDVLALAHSDIMTRNVSVTTQLDPEASPVLGDRVQLQQVLLNLVINACEVMAANAPAERRLSIGTRISPQLGTMECYVADRGPGVPADQLRRIFEPFVTTKRHGLGLGLAICRSIVEAHGGRLWAENAESGGAVFHFITNVDS